jgi:hypothetical protein
MEEEVVILELSKDEGLVFYEFLCTVNRQEKFPFGDQAAAVLIKELEILLSAELSETRQPDYAERIKQARANIQGSAE